MTKGARYLLKVEDAGATFGRIVILAASDADARRQAALILALFPLKTGELVALPAGAIAGLPM